MGSIVQAAPDSKTTSENKPAAEKPLEKDSTTPPQKVCPIIADLLWLLCLLEHSAQSRLLQLFVKCW